MSNASRVGTFSKCNYLCGRLPLLLLHFVFIMHSLVYPYVTTPSEDGV